MKPLKITAIGVAGILVAASLLLAWGIPAGFLLGTIQNRFEAETGYRLQIAGDTKIALWPSPRVAARNVNIFKANDGGAQGQFVAESVQLDIPFGSLFSTRPQISEIAIVRPVVRVPLIRERAARPADSSGNSAPARPAPPFTVALVTIQDGTVVLFGARDRVERRIERIDLRASLADLNNRLDLTADAYMGDQLLRLRLAGNVPTGLERQTIPIELTFEAPGLLQERLSTRADVKSSGSLLMINGLTGTIGQSKLNGWASIDFAGKPLVKLDLDAQRIDLAVPRAGASGSGDGGKANWDQPWSDQPVRLEELNFFDAEVRFSAAQFNIDTFRFAPISIEATLASGVLKAAISHAGLYEGQAQGALTVDASGAVANHALRMDLDGVRALPLLTDVADFGALDGRMQAKIDVRANGASRRAVMSTLGGSIDILLQDGEIRGVNVAKMIRTLTANMLTGWQANTAEKTDLTQLSALFRVDSGKATTDNLRLLGPLARVSGTGAADLAAKTLQFRLDPKLVLSLEGQGGTADPVGLGVPVVVQGSWSEPRIYPDVAGILDNPDAAYAKLRALGTGLFGNSKGQSGTGVDSLMQGLGSFLDRFGSDRKDGQNPAESGKQPSQQDNQNPIRDLFRDLFSR
jgi:AsmA protein